MKDDFEGISDDDQIFRVELKDCKYLSQIISFPGALLTRINAFEIAVVVALLHQDRHKIRFSQNQLAFLSGMSRASLQRTLNSLKDKRLVDWVIDKANGNSYFLTMHHTEASDASHRCNDLPDASHRGIQCSTTNTSMHHTEASRQGVLGSGDASHLYISSSSNEEEGLEDKKDKKDNIYNNNTGEHTTTEKPSTQKKGLKIPDKLQPVRDLLITWWKFHKGGLKTQTSWNILLGEFDKILNDPNVSNDIEAISQILISAIDSSEKGKPWQSIRYQNWVEYNREKWIKFKEAQTSKLKAPTYTGIVIPEYHKKD